MTLEMRTLRSCHNGFGPLSSVAVAREAMVGSPFLRSSVAVAFNLLFTYNGEKRVRKHSEFSSWAKSPSTQ